MRSTSRKLARFFVSTILIFSAVVSLCAYSGIASAEIHRSETAKNHFKKLHPCPANNQDHGSCPGYVIDHVKPLACGGADDPSNMQWQTVIEGKAKDRWERIGCQIKHANHPDIEVVSSLSVGMFSMAGLMFVGITEPAVNLFPDNWDTSTKNTFNIEPPAAAPVNYIDTEIRNGLLFIPDGGEAIGSDTASIETFSPSESTETV